jgi:dTDP-4-amino-4,6-dideoxygalactose transaminase
VAQSGPGCRTTIRCMPPPERAEPEPPPRPRVNGTIPVLRPLLPSADRLLPYLRRIDQSRTYTNWGPLATELERRLCQHFSLPGPGIVSASSGTTALVGAILATAGRARPEHSFAVLPAFTFVATAAAAQACGYTPYLVDVAPDNWQLDPATLVEHDILRRSGVVIPVAPFGRPVEQDRWLTFRRRSGIPVVIDGAASFEALSDAPGRFIGDIPVSLSFHATKIFATGEGGCVATSNARCSMQVVEALNFGFHASRESRSASTNGKMSEYHAAVGLAELDGWTVKRANFHSVATSYERQLAAAGLAGRCVVAPAVAGSYVLYRCADADEARRVRQSLTEHRVGFRYWYGCGLHAEPYLLDGPRDALPITDRISPLIIGLPVAPDLPDEMIADVVGALTEAVG